ncbi:cellulase family glycosylhydrolase [Nocardioides sp. C4-1]|uniref:cellulase family glycosylhydrolase n=1 Tax=Nocardioides sp. C4-1 TaxID=3151851 RepID=UPI003264464D
MALAVTLLAVPTASAREPLAAASVSAAKPGAANAVTADAAERRQKKRKKWKAPRVPVGVSPGFGVIDLSPAAQAADFRAAKSAGVNRVRLDVGWARIEQSPGQYNWADTDRVIRSARQAGLQVLAVTGYRPHWARPLKEAAGRRQFARFVGAAARRYRTQVRSWELWNEPNRTMGWDGDLPSPVVYARMVDVVGAAIRRSAPRARIVIGAFSPADDAADGSAYSPVTFLRQVYAAGVDRRRFDAVSVHPYSYPALPGSTESWNTFFRMRAMYDVMRRAGDGRKKIWMTEYGAPTGASDRSVPGDLQAQMITQAITLARRLPFTGPIYLYALRDLSNEPADIESNFGLIGHDGQPKPAYFALRSMLRRAN